MTCAGTNVDIIFIRKNGPDVIFLHGPKKGAVKMSALPYLKKTGVLASVLAAWSLDIMIVLSWLVVLGCTFKLLSLDYILD